jgi:hypothetical protein
LAGAGDGFHWINLKKGDDRQGKKKIKSRIKEEELTIIASCAHWRCSLLPRRRRGGG